MPNTFKFLPWSRDHWLSRKGNILPYDKAEHFIRETVLTIFGLVIWGPFPWLIIVAGFGIVYEIKDGFGSEGFSLKDMIANFCGIAAGTGLVLGLRGLGA